LNKRKSSNEDWVLETLRLDYTDLTQDEFIVKCGLSRTTYQRWVRGKAAPRLTPEQIVNVCRICRISFSTFFTKLGLNVGDIPKK
jgi:transcriptional regulator with XRE-family HTH domain